MGALPPTTGSLSVVSNPTGAAISIDGVAKGTTPVTIPNLAIGSHTLTATKAGYQTLTQPVTVTAGTTTIPLNLVPATGSLYVTSVPTGADLPLFLQKRCEIDDLRQFLVFLPGFLKHALLYKDWYLSPDCKSYAIAWAAIDIFIMPGSREDELGIIHPVLDAVDLEEAEQDGTFLAQVDEKIVGERPGQQLVIQGTVDRDCFPDPNEDGEHAVAAVRQHNQRDGCCIIDGNINPFYLTSHLRHNRAQ
jgi:hypothetical protein